VPVVACLLGMACLAMSSVWHLAGLFLGLTAVRCLGQGALTLLSTWMVGHWFDRRKGLALGLLGLGSTLSFMAFPASNHFLIEQFGWRGAWIGLGLGVWVLLMLPAFLLIRNRPRDLGLEGDPHLEKRSADGTLFPIEPAPAWTAGQACRTATFWKILSSLSTSALVSTGLVFHQVSLLADRGVSSGLALSTLSLQAAFACGMSLIGGMLADRIEPRRLLASSMLMLFLAIILLLLVDSPALLLPYSILLGLHTGVQRCSGSLAILNAFGRLHFGAVKGLVMALVIGASALGPLPLALAKDWLGHYDVALFTLLVLPLISGIAVWTANPPKP
jgi:MFS family permease